MTIRFHRRKLLKQGALIGAGAAGTRLLGVPAVLAERSPNDKLGTVVIGCANQGLVSVNAAAEERLVAMVDVDERHLAQSRQWLTEHHPNVKVSGVKTYFDYRQMFDEIEKEIDAVFVATPDHHHAPAAMRAIKRGKGVYVEKPLAHTIGEVRTLMDAARKNKVATQMGNQGHSGEGIRRLCEYIWAGAIGNVTETHSWAPTGRGGVGGRLPSQPVPPGLHWDQWIGPAPYREYHAELHPKDWRSWWDFGCGSVGDWGCHNLDGPLMALKLGHPTSIEAVEQIGGSDERFPLLSVIRWDFPARGEMPALKVFWHDGYRGFDPKRVEEDSDAAQKAQNRPPIVLELEQKYGRDLKNGGTVYLGDKGIMVTGNYAGSPRIIPEQKHREFPVPEKKLPRIKGTHQADFLRAVRDGRGSCADFGYSGALTEMVLLGTLAIRAGTGRRVEWDGSSARCTNLPELNALVHREHRSGWGLD